MEVGIRELRDGLSRYLAKVREGQEIVVTDHGKPVARIVPHGESAYDRMVAEGLITPARRPKRPINWEPIKAKGSVLETLLEMRAEAYDGDDHP